MRNTILSLIISAVLGCSSLAQAEEPKLDPKDEVEALMKKGMRFAEQLLDDYGEFFPFARVMNSSGKIQHLMATTGEDENPPSEDIISLLEAAFRKGAKAEEYRATAIFVHVLVTPPGGSETDAVQAGLEHESGYCVNVYFPYNKNESGEIQFGELFANERQGSVFDACD